jgi:hypothetical protein
MSFKYGQFGTGFLRIMPPAAALRFRNLVNRRGRGVQIIELTETGQNAYGQPIYTESSHEEKVFLERKGSERDLPPGTIKENLIRLFMARWAAIQEDGCEVEVDGARYHINSLDETDAYLMVEAERKA